MRKCWMVFAILAMVMTVNFPAKAGEIGFGIFFSAGTEKDPIEGVLGLYSDVTGQTLTPVAGIVEVPEGEGVIGQVVINDNRDNNRFRVNWGINTRSSDLDEARSTDDAGWTFHIDAKDLFQVTDVGRPLHVEVQDRKGSRRFIRVIFKIPYGGKNSVYQRSVLILKTVPKRANMASGSTSASASDAVLEANQKLMADHVNTLTDRVNRIEDYLASLPSNSNSVNVVFNFIGKVPDGFMIRISGPSGPVERPVVNNQVIVPLPIGENYTMCLGVGKDYGPNQPFWVRKGMKAVKVRCNF